MGRILLICEILSDSQTGPDPSLLDTVYEIYLFRPSVAKGSCMDIPGLNSSCGLIELLVFAELAFVEVLTGLLAKSAMWCLPWVLDLGDLSLLSLSTDLIVLDFGQPCAIIFHYLSERLQVLFVLLIIGHCLWVDVCFVREDFTLEEAVLFLFLHLQQVLSKWSILLVRTAQEAPSIITDPEIT